MKVLFVVPLESSEYRSSQFEWLSDASNRLFVIEAGKRLRTISISTEPGKVLESANLVDGRVCTNFSWNKDGNQLAMVVDKHLIYFWDVRDNNLVHYRPSSKTPSDINSARTRNRTKDVDHIVWSKTTNKVVIGYSTGQLLLCNHESGLSERFVDSSSGVLREISCIESSPHSDVFGCITVIFELLVMTFDGEFIFYNQDGYNGMSVIKFSPPFMFKSATQVKQASRASNNRSSNQSFWLAHNGQNDSRINFELIELKERHPSESYSNGNLAHRMDEGHEKRVIYFDWVDSSNLIVCSASGMISLVQVKDPSDKSGEYNLSSTRMIQIHTGEFSVTNVDGVGSADVTQKRELFSSFKLISHNKFDTRLEDRSSSSCGKSFSFSAMTRFRLFYYELLEMGNNDTSPLYTFERVDELDLTGDLKRIGLNLERLQWSADSSMLAVQLSNGHIWIYQTRLQDQMITSYGSQRTAYLSEPDEVTILNYGPSGGESDDDDEFKSLSDSQCNRSSPADSNMDTGSSLELTSRASIIKVHLKPSVIAIGPKHLAIGLNNLVRFYSTHSGEFKFQEEYYSIVTSICLSLKFISVQFDYGRVKLHPLKGSKVEGGSSGEDGGGDFLNERYFPDPTKPESISAFTLTDHLFMYCTSSPTFNLYVFCLKNWTHIQSFNYHSSTGGQNIVKLVPNGKGNKYLCLTDTLPHSQCRVFLYDSYRNEMISFLKRNNKLYAKIFQSQLDLVPTLNPSTVESIPFDHETRLLASRSMDLSRISSVIWDTDGRSVLLVERRHIHIFVILDHTLESEGPIVEWVTSVGKQSTYATLYASQGVISFQTSLGRVINSISEPHDDEANLAKLSEQIQAAINESSTEDAIKDSSLGVVQAEIMRLKLKYLKMIVLICPLGKCAQICEYIMNDNQFNVAEELRLAEIDDVLWRQLAARALFTSNLRFALLVYKGRRLQVFARALADIMDDSCRFGFDSRSSIKTRLLILLGCDLDDDQ